MAICMLTCPCSFIAAKTDMIEGMNFSPPFENSSLMSLRSELHFTRLDRLQDPDQFALHNAASNRMVERGRRTVTTNTSIAGTRVNTQSLPYVEHLQQRRWHCDSVVSHLAQFSISVPRFSCRSELSRSAGRERGHSIGFGVVEYRDEAFIAELLKTITDDQRTWPNVEFWRKRGQLR